MEPRFTLHNNKSLNRILGQGYYRNSFGLSFAGLLKAFTTQFDGNPIFPHYSSGVNNSLNPYILNPYGFSNVYEGIIHGDNLPVDLEGNAAELFANRRKVRSYGLKAPMTLVGWGYDIFGYPAPNNVSGWTDYGVYGNQTPTGRFAGSGALGIEHGGNVPYEKWIAAPVDFRYDPHRKVWTNNYGVYPAVIYNAYNNGVKITDFDEPLFAESITYDAYVFDGNFSGIMVTGVKTETPRPKTGTYKVFPNSTGQVCLIANKWATPNTRPGFGILTPEVPYAQDCTTETVDYLLDLILQGSGITYNQLDSTPLQTQYGGTGFDSIASGQILIGDGGGNFSKRNLTAGTGLSIRINGSDAIVEIASGVDFVLGDGVNFSITALSGLTTPLSIGQGGTNSSVKNFVDLSNPQSVSGIKSWLSQSQFSTGSSGNPGISWNAANNYGLYFNNQEKSIQIISSGTAVEKITTSGITHNQSTAIRPSTNYYPSLMVFQRQSLGVDLASGISFYSTDIQTWHDTSGNRVATVDNTGFFGSQGFKIYNTGYTNSINLLPSTGNFTDNYRINVRPINGTLALLSDISAPSEFSGSGLHVTGIRFYDTTHSNYVHVGIDTNINNNYQLRPQATGGIIPTRAQVPFFSWNEEPSGVANGINRLFVLRYNVYPTGAILLFKNAVKQRMGPSHDFVLSSGNLINFNLTSVPSSGSYIEATYQHDLYGDHYRNVPDVPIVGGSSVIDYGSGAEA